MVNTSNGKILTTPSSKLVIKRSGVATQMSHLHLGYCERFNHTFPLYDLDGLVVMMMRDGMSYEEAVEYYQYNYVGAWTGEDTPGFFVGTTKTPFAEFPET
tara:strand:- start:712 stop:1014 length:303 start_codon:yes stop_codon:yes gene_type:complete